MPTHEERLSTLEQSVAVLNRGIWDIYHNETILLGMAIKQEENIQEVKLSLAALGEHLNTFEHSVNGRFESLDDRVGALDDRVGALDDRIGAFEHSVNGRFGALEQSMNTRFEGQDKKFDQILLLLNTLIPKSE